MAEDYTNAYYILNTDVIYVDTEGTEWTEVTVVVFMYNSCLHGMSTRQIARTLTRLGIPTQRGKDAWNNTTVRQILTNINYTGNAYSWRRVRENGKSRFPQDGEIKLPDGIYPKIIEPEVYEQVQKQLARNAELSPRNNKHPQLTLLRGMIYCGICG